MFQIKRNTYIFVDRCKGFSYKDNYRWEGVRVVNSRPEVIIFCKSRPFNWQLEDNNQQRNQASSTTMTTRLHDTSLKGASWKSIVEISCSV